MDVISLETTKLSPSTKALAENTLFCGLAVGTLFGPSLAISAMATNVVLSQLNSQDTQRRWIPLEKRSIQQFKDYWPSSKHVFKLQILFGIAIGILGITIPQVDVIAIKEAIGSITKLALVFFRFCIISPILQEITFRGFIQEKIRDIQVLIHKTNKTTQKMVRVGLQALIYGFFQYHPSQGIYNYIIVPAATYMGIYLGNKKEDTHTIVQGIGGHSHLNASIAARVIAFGT